MTWTAPTFGAHRPWDRTPIQVELPYLPGAACKGMDPEIFVDMRHKFEAKAVCASCPVIEECLEWCVTWELRNGRLEGVWGNRTPGERDEFLEGAVKLCSAGIHKMEGNNLKPLSGHPGQFRCRACWYEASNRSKAVKRSKIAALRQSTAAPEHPMDRQPPANQRPSAQPA